ncbi:MAG TPA: MFS transporter [Candidatus Acidoferrum sp.]|jgi:fucose permease|nr:MFS transporter [Candidatus Acidoferrum sp.]
MMSSKTQTWAIASPSSQTVIFYLLGAGFVLNGIVISLIGPILPMFMAKWGLNYSRAGLFSLVQFSASFIGVLASSALISAKGFKPAITLGIALLGLGFALLNAPSFVLALAASGLYGLGYGLATPGTNLWVGESYGARRASALNVMNLAWGAGAISSSPLAMLAMRTSHVSLLLNVVGVLGVVLALVLLRMPFGRPAQEGNSSSEDAKGKTTGPGVAILLGVLFFVYVGTEAGTSYWAPTHAQRAATWVSNIWALAPMFFFGGLLGGRGAAAAILLHWKEVTVAVGGLLLAATGESIFLAGHSPATLFGGAFLAGLGLASIFPILIAWLSKWYGTRARKVGGVMFALAALGSALMPPAVGVVSRYSESLRIGLLVPLAGCAVMLAVIGVLRPGARG